VTCRQITVAVENVTVPKAVPPSREPEARGGQLTGMFAAMYNYKQIDGATNISAQASFSVERHQSTTPKKNTTPPVHGD
jgi:hypothetical protein